MVRSTSFYHQRRFVLPQPAQLTKGVRIDDLFHRASLNPPYAIPFYTVATQGRGGTATPMLGPGRTSLSILTSGFPDNSVDVRLSELCFERCKKANDEFRRFITVRVLFCPENSKSMEGFVGLMMGANAQISEIPTVAAHMGISWDLSSGENYAFTSSDGKVQDKKDTGIKLHASQDYMIRIDWTDFDHAKLTFQGDEGNTIVQKEINSLGHIDTAVLHFFIKNETASPREMRVVHWTAQAE